MNKRFTSICCVVLALGFSTSALAGKKSSCETIKGGYIYDPLGDVIERGYNSWGYNYQAKKFNGNFCDAYFDANWCQEWSDDELSMKWNSAWLDNKDCDGDGALDRHAGYDSYLGSGAWLTNHQSGTYLDEETGEECSWFHFTKIVAAPEDAELYDGVWYNVEGDEIGPARWGQFVLIQEVSNNTCTGEHGLSYRSPVSPGLGGF